MSATVADYALLSDCQTAALVDTTGSVVWESVDGPSVFSQLLDADAGHFDLRPVGAIGSHRRYRRREDIPDEGALPSACFRLAACQALSGELDAARATCERALAAANDVGLLPEMADPATGAGMGNVPQALSHVGLIAAANLLRADRVPAGAAAGGGGADA